MPNLQIIKDLSFEKKITIRKIAESIGITEAGLHGAISKGDIKFSYLDKIAHFLKVDLSAFSDYPPVSKSGVSVSSSGNNLGNIAGGNIIQVSLPEAGQQKIIKPDGTAIVEPISQNNNGNLASEERQALLDKLELQQALIDSLKDQLAMYKEKCK